MSMHDNPSYEEKIATQASELVKVQTEADQAKRTVERAQMAYDNLMNKALGIVEELKKCTGNNLPERNVVVNGKIVQIRQDSVVVKEYIAGK